MYTKSNFHQPISLQLYQLRNLNERGVFLGEKNLDSEDVAVDAKECEEDVGRHSGFLQIGNDEDAAASLHATGHSHQSHALGGIAESTHAPAAELVVVTATLICAKRGRGLGGNYERYLMGRRSVIRLVRHPTRSRFKRFFTLLRAVQTCRRTDYKHAHGILLLSAWQPAKCLDIVNYTQILIIIKIQYLLPATLLKPF